MEDRKMYWIVLSTLIGFILLGINKIMGDPRENKELSCIRYIEELDMYFAACDIQKNGVNGVSLILFSHHKDSLIYPDFCNSMRNTDSSFVRAGVLKPYDEDLRFCRIDNELVCVVSNKVLFHSVDCPIVTYDDEGYFLWNGEKHWLLDHSFIAVNCAAQYIPASIWWYPFDPNIDNWELELRTMDCIAAQWPLDTLMAKHNKKERPVGGYACSSPRANGGLDIHGNKRLSDSLREPQVQIRPNRPKQTRHKGKITSPIIDIDLFEGSDNNNDE